MKVLLQLKTEDPARKHRAAEFKKKAPRKKRAAGAPEPKIPPLESVQHHRNKWSWYWLDIGEFEVSLEEYDSLAFLTHVPGLMMGDVVRVIPLAVRDGTDQAMKYADILPAVAVQAIEQPEDMGPYTSTPDIFSDDWEDEEDDD